MPAAGSSDDITVIDGTILSRLLSHCTSQPKTHTYTAPASLSWASSLYVCQYPAKPHIPSHLPQHSMQSPHGLTIVPPAAQTFIAGQPRSAVPLNNAVAPHNAAPPYSAAPTSAAPLHTAVLHNGAASAHSALTSEPLSVLLVSLQPVQTNSRPGSRAS